MFDRLWVWRIAAMVVAVFATVALATVLLRPDRTAVPGPTFARQFVASCGRTGADEPRCRCAYDRWQELVEGDQLLSLDQSLRDGGALPADLVAALADC